MEISVPVIATRGIIVFPQQDIMIEVGGKRAFVPLRKQKKSSMVMSGSSARKTSWLTILLLQISTRSAHCAGSKISAVKEGFMRITFSGLERAKLVSIQDEDRMFMATVLPVADEAGDNLEEMALIRRVAKELRISRPAPTISAGDHCSADQGRFRADAVRISSRSISRCLWKRSRCCWKR